MIAIRFWKSEKTERLNVNAFASFTCNNSYAIFCSFSFCWLASRLVVKSDLFFMNSCNSYMQRKKAEYHNRRFFYTNNKIEATGTCNFNTSSHLHNCIVFTGIPSKALYDGKSQKTWLSMIWAELSAEFHFLLGKLWVVCLECCCRFLVQKSIFSEHRISIIDCRISVFWVQNLHFPSKNGILGKFDQ